VTINPAKPAQPALVTKTGKHLETTKPTQLQICPWFLTWVKSKKRRLQKEVLRTNVGQIVINSVTSLNLGLKQIGKTTSTYTQIVVSESSYSADAFALLDKVLLHEMTHGRAAYEHIGAGYRIDQEGLNDVPDPASRMRYLGLGFAAYGWTSVMSFARKGEDLGMTKAPDNNADTVA